MFSLSDKVARLQHVEFYRVFQEIYRIVFRNRLTKNLSSSLRIMFFRGPVEANPALAFVWVLQQGEEARRQHPGVKPDCPS